MNRHQNSNGILLISAGIVLLLSALGFFPHIPIMTIIFTIILVTFLLGGIRTVNYFEIIVSAALLFLLYRDYLAIKVAVWPLIIAAVLIGFGLQAMNKRPKKKFSNNADTRSAYDSNIYIQARFNGLVRYIDAQDFKSANIDCRFAGCEVYFNRAQIPSGKAEIVVDNSFGGVELYIPKSWSVISDVKSSFGVVEEKNRAATNGYPIVEIKGTNSFGGIEIIYI